MVYCKLCILVLLLYHVVWCQENVPYLSSGQFCDDEMKRDTTVKDVEFLYDKFTKRYTGKLSFLGEYPNGLTSCEMDPLSPMQILDGWYPLAVGPMDYTHSLMCGACIKIAPRSLGKRSFKNETEVIRYGTVVDQCNHCNEGDIHMYADGDGVHDIIYEAIECPELTGQDGFIRLKASKCGENDKRMRVQLKNTKIPTTALEIFQDESWKCLPRTSNNFFIMTLSHDENAETDDFPLEARSSSINGQTMGFTINRFDLNQDIVIPVQYHHFDETANDGKPPLMKCYKRGKKEEDEYLIGRHHSMDVLHKLPNRNHFQNENGHTIIRNETKDIEPAAINTHNIPHLKVNRIKDKTSSSSLLKYINEPDDSQKIKSNNSLNIDPPINTNLTTNTTLRNSTMLLAKHINNTYHTVMKLYKAVYHPLKEVNQQPDLKRVISKYCALRSDGQYEYPENCAAFLICKEGNSYVKHCPNGLLFNPVESVCDWPNNVNCRNSLEKTGESSISNLLDDEVYTKKFANPFRKFKDWNDYKRNEKLKN